MKKLKEIFEGLKGTDNETLIVEINTAVDAIKAKAIIIKDKEIETLQNAITQKDEELSKLGKETFDNSISTLIEKLVGDDEKAQERLKKLTSLGDEKDKQKIKELFEKTIKDNSDIFGEKEEEEEEEEFPEVSSDENIDGKDFKQNVSTPKTKDNEISIDALTEDK